MNGLNLDLKNRLEKGIMHMARSNAKLGVRLGEAYIYHFSYCFDKDYPDNSPYFQEKFKYLKKEFDEVLPREIEKWKIKVFFC